MRWNRLFKALEDQLASESEAERAAIDSEEERLRVSRLTLRERLIALGAGTPLVVETSEGSLLSAVLAAVGADFAGLRPEASSDALMLVPLGSIAASCSAVNRGGITGSIITSRSTRSGRSAANSIATKPPKLCPATSAGSRSAVT